jgi:alpha-amylase
MRTLLRSSAVLLFSLGCAPTDPMSGPEMPPLVAGVGIPGGSKCAAVELLPEQGAVAVGGTLQMSATAFNKKGNSIPSALIQWASSFNSVAAVSSTGLVTGVSAGETHILASCAGIVDSVPVVVSP